MDERGVSGSDEGRLQLARQLVDEVLADQIARSDSLHSAAAALVGLAGVITALAAESSSLPVHPLGEVGLSAAGLSAVGGVGVLLVPRPGREPVELESLVTSVLSADDVDIAADSVIEMDLEAANRSNGWLETKSVLFAAAAGALTLSVVSLVAASILYAR